MRNATVRDLFAPFRESSWADLGSDTPRSQCRHGWIGNGCLVEDSEAVRNGSCWPI